VGKRYRESTDNNRTYTAEDMKYQGQYLRRYSPETDIEGFNSENHCNKVLLKQSFTLTCI